MKRFNWLVKHSFIGMVAVAAWLHTAWVVSVFMGGLPPAVVDFASFAHWCLWGLPGALFATALDIGQINTAAQIQAGKGRRVKVFGLTINVKLFTFALMGVFSYVLQLKYLLHHMPYVPLGDGLHPDDVIASVTISRLITWGGPAGLPLIVWFYSAGDQPESEVHGTINIYSNEHSNLRVLADASSVGVLDVPTSPTIAVEPEKVAVAAEELPKGKGRGGARRGSANVKAVQNVFPLEVEQTVDSVVQAVEQ
jgi:hypothetical protein